jgi:hypothetical protein
MMQKRLRCWSDLERSRAGLKRLSRICGDAHRSREALNLSQHATANGVWKPVRERAVGGGPLLSGLPDL